jgi:hypothetical protein
MATSFSLAKGGPAGIVWSPLGLNFPGKATPAFSPTSIDPRALRDNGAAPFAGDRATLPVCPVQASFC